jgi:hypothetical protein
MGDTKRMAWMFGFLTALGVIAAFFLPWYDQPQSYAEIYGIEGMFDMLMTGIHCLTVVFGLVTVILIIIAKRVEPRDCPADI